MTGTLDEEIAFYQRTGACAASSDFDKIIFDKFEFFSHFKLPASMNSVIPAGRSFFFLLQRNSFSFLRTNNKIDPLYGDDALLTGGGKGRPELPSSGQQEALPLTLVLPLSFLCVLNPMMLSMVLALFMGRNRRLASFPARRRGQLSL